MSTRLRQSRFQRTKWCVTSLVCWLFAASVIAADKPAIDDHDVSGEELFSREWIPNDPRSHGGDGLGPVFNESSCVACHNLGGVGGGGANDKNVQIMTANVLKLDEVKRRLSQHGARTAETVKEAENFDKQFRRELARFHPDFRNAKTVVVHRFGVDPKHADWRFQLQEGSNARFAMSSRVTGSFSQFQTARASRSIFVERSFPMPAIFSLVPSGVLRPRFDKGFDSSRPQSTTDRRMTDVSRRARLSISQEILLLKSRTNPGISSMRSFGLATILTSQRNTTALFGAGLIDAIPDTAFHAAADRKFKDFPGISGRVHRLKKGDIGRFGWKAEVSSLYNFTMAACGVELGLNVPDHPQAVIPYDPEYKTAGFDLNQREADALVAYLANLPRPVQQAAEHPALVKELSEGAQLFKSSGCAACHVQQMGTVDGLFGDLLLHDMGPDLVSPGSSYGRASFRPPGSDQIPLAQTNSQDATRKPVPPTAQEWRTPPLWGVRDSAPYLHDGRAETLEQAIAFHGGEAADARLRFFMLPHEKRQKIISFLKSLVAPSSTTNER